MKIEKVKETLRQKYEYSRRKKSETEKSEMEEVQTLTQPKPKSGMEGGETEIKNSGSSSSIRLE